MKFKVGDKVTQIIIGQYNERGEGIGVIPIDATPKLIEAVNVLSTDLKKIIDYLNIPTIRGEDE